MVEIFANFVAQVLNKSFCIKLSVIQESYKKKVQCVPARGGTICRRAGSRLPCIFTLYLLCTKMTVQVPFGSHKLLKLVCLSILEIFTNFVGQVLNKILKNSDRKKFKFYLIPKQRNSPRSPPSLYRPISNPYGNQMGP